MKRLRGNPIAVLTLAAVGGLASATLSAHHSFAMYDQSIKYVFTGVVERINPDAAHLQIAFVPLNETRDALVRDSSGKPATWLVEMGGSAASAREGITIFYDPEAFVQPVRDIRFFSRRGDFGDAPPIHHDHCNQTIFVGEDGRGTQVPPGTTINYTVRDLYDRPWARIWEQYFEKGMKRPAAADDLGGFK